MVKISLTIRTLFDQPAPFARFFIRAPKYRVLGSIEALVDTGAPFSVIAPRDAEKLKIPISSLGSNPHPIGLAGIKLFAYKMEDVKLWFRSEEGKTIQIDLSSINVLEPTKKDDETRNIAQHIPSILGMDFLMDKGFILHFNPKAKIAFLQTE